MISYEEDEKVEARHAELIDALTAISNRLSILVSSVHVFLTAKYQSQPELAGRIEAALEAINKKLIKAECGESEVCQV